MTELARRAAAEAAALLAEDGMRLGLGTGRTMELVLRALAGRMRGGLRFTGVATSEATAARARALGIALVAAERPCDLAIDGADEIERGSLRLIKGGGGALLREKIVAEAARRFVVVAEAGKLVDRLGEFALPVEVVPFGCAVTAARIAALGGAPVLRRCEGGPVRTDNGNLILDCPGFAPIGDPFTLERRLRAVAGVVASGLFLLPVERAIIGHGDGRVEELLP